MNSETVLSLSKQTEVTTFNENSFLLINNTSGKYLKINQNFEKLISLFDGKKNLAQIRETYNENSQKEISEENCFAIIKKLDDLGIFSESTIILKNNKLPPYISFGFIFIKKNWVSKIVPHLKFLFSKKIAIFTVSLCLLILTFSFYRSFSTINTLNIGKIIPLFFCISFIGTMFHELGHATATHFYKAKHGGIGFGLYLYFMPVFFADVTDIWRLSKWKRIVVNSSGVYFEVLYYSLLLLFSLAIQSKNLLLICAFLSLKSLYNLLPYFRADGYWIASDYFNQPSLMQTSFQKLKLFVLLKVQKFKRKDYFLAIYGLFNFGLMAYFVGFMIVYHHTEIIKFPTTILEFFINLRSQSFKFKLSDMGVYFPVIIFYFFAIRILIGLVKKSKSINN